MRYLFLVLCFLFIGCLGQKNLEIPGVGEYSDVSDSQIFVFSDTDIIVNESGVDSDDTMVIIFGGQDSSEQLVEGMKEIQKIFKEKCDVYRSWVIKKGE